ncbi:formate dehydrogenase accessory sulfurtransferase FdhD [Georgenia thermotolerans]|uniref:Sulfur carrier protein FdhD n=1 Tax=Georgenia thermotolerans TaxID=527326 RepID=A0A7J5UKI0_9MICO|nr:formate dehydrogenase accessory sulfurtransferase FdhD [Georgenia thermotolerans]KAE8762915.1 formate dehydrogenase accessory sulfurtransferase FdhD [Georgenia thermotolerans]
MRATKRRPVVRLGADGARRARADTLAGEEPLEIRVAGAPYSVTMRTPGADFDLVAGFLVSEGVVWDAGHIASIGYGAGVNPDGSRSYNLVEVRLAPGVAPPSPDLARHVYTSSSCGICGTASIEAVTRASRFPVGGDGLRIRLDELLALGERLRRGQQVFDTTGGVHAAGLFAVDDDGTARLECLREDVGRHNAVDKAVGWALREGRLPLRRAVLQVSGRASFELVQKAHMAGVPALAAVSAPSALAVELAEECGITLVGFSRGESVNVYAGEQRILV